MMNILQIIISFIFTIIYLTGLYEFNNFLTFNKLDESILENRLIELNEERKLNGITKELKINENLQKTAEDYSKEMFHNSLFDHKDKDGNRVSERVLRNKYDYHIVLENLGRGFNNFSDLLEGFKNSSSHRDNLFNKDVEEVGIGEYRGYWTLILGKEFKSFILD